MFARRVICRCRGKHGGAVDEDIEAAEFFFDLIKHFLDRACVRKLCLKCRSRISGNFLCLTRARSVVNRKPRASARKLERDISPDTFCRSRD